MPISRVELETLAWPDILISTMLYQLSYTGLVKRSLLNLPILSSTKDNDVLLSVEDDSLANARHPSYPLTLIILSNIVQS